MAGIITKLNINGVERNFRDPDAITAIAIANGTYAGVNLAAKFADEISGNVWAWIKARITAGDYSGINVGDHIQFTADDHTYHAQAAGINTSTGTGSTAIGNHIDFVCRELWHNQHRWNATATNQGTAAQASPWLASEIYGWLNSTVYDTFPTALKDVISPKYMYNPTRYSSSGNLAKHSGGTWETVGTLWLPMEAEVFDYQSFSTASVFVNRYCVQYPLFRSAANRIKSASGSTNRASWWLMNGRETPGNSAEAANDYNMICAVYSTGIAQPLTANSVYNVPICFRIGG